MNILYKLLDILPTTNKQITVYEKLLFKFQSQRQKIKAAKYFLQGLGKNKKPTDKEGCIYHWICTFNCLFRVHCYQLQTTIKNKLSLAEIQVRSCGDWSPDIIYRLCNHTQLPFLPLNNKEVGLDCLHPYHL